jgi:predicted dehydrogenase
MRFALVGDHPDGIELASALVETGRHQLAACTTAISWEGPRRASEHTEGIELPSALVEAPRPAPPSWAAPRRVSDLEEVLADPAIEAVIVAGGPSVRPAQLRRALQSERHVVCVHPADDSPEVAYEAALLQQDTGCVLFPLLPEPLHPALRRLAAFIERPSAEQPARSPVGAFRLLEVEQSAEGEVLDNVNGQKPAVPGWSAVRALGGEVVEVSALAEGEEVEAGAPLLLAGRFERGGLLQMTLVPREQEARLRFTVIGTAGRAEVFFPLGWQGPAFLEWREGPARQEEHWEAWSPWPALVEELEKALDGGKVSAGSAWENEVRALELDDAARRSVERRRTDVLDRQDISEEVGFKGTMTLVGCALLWGVLLLLIASRWVPQIGWAILPLLVLFIGLQLLRFIIPAKPRDEQPPRQGD